MKHNKNSQYEKPMSECPAHCADCAYFSNNCNIGTCTANGCRTPTFDFSRPTDRPLPQPLNCYWWYANNVWSKLSGQKFAEYAEERRHLIVAHTMLETITDRQERLDFIKHIHRIGGYGLIDFNTYPQAREIYAEVAKKDGVKT